MEDQDYVDNLLKKTNEGNGFDKGECSSDVLRNIQETMSQKATVMDKFAAGWKASPVSQGKVRTSIRTIQNWKMII